MNRLRTTHGLSSINGKRSPTYTIWLGMKYRCASPSCSQFRDYGGRGINVCDRWLHSFENFFADMGERPIGKEIDRIDNDGNYEPGNCRWVTRLVNANNKRNNRVFTHDGITMTEAEWARKLGCSRGLIGNRIDISRMSVADALTTPVDLYENRRKSSNFATITFGGETLTYDQWGPRVGLLPSTIASRTKRGWSPEEALTTPARDMGRRKP